MLEGGGDGRQSRGGAWDCRRGFASGWATCVAPEVAAKGKWGGAGRLLREFQADAHALVIAEERRDHGEVGIAHLAEEGGGSAEESQEFVGLEEEGNAVAVARNLGLEVEKTADELEAQGFGRGVEAISSAHVAAVEGRGEGFVGIESEARHAFADAVAFELLVDFGFECARCGYTAGLCQEVLAFEHTADAVVGPSADEVALRDGAAVE